jgi:hypothetical protein
MRTDYPPIMGIPGGGLADPSAATWAHSAGTARAGERGEALTAEVLTHFARKGGPSVLHHLMLPVKSDSGDAGDVDHVVVSGRDLWILDSKFWLPGRYWTLAGVTRRGLAAFALADKRYLGFATRVLETRCRQLAVDANIHVPVVVVWPSRRTGKVSVVAYRPPGAKAISGRRLEWWCRRHISGHPRTRGWSRRWSDCSPLPRRGPPERRPAWRAEPVRASVHTWGMADISASEVVLLRVLGINEADLTRIRLEAISARPGHPTWPGDGRWARPRQQDSTAEYMPLCRMPYSDE